MSDAPTAEWLGTFEPDLDNLRTALSWAFGPQGDPALGLRLLGRTHWFWCELPLLREQRRWFELAWASSIGHDTAGNRGTYPSRAGLGSLFR